MNAIPKTVLGKLQVIVSLLEEPKECECDRCGDTHITSGGILANLPKEEKEKLIAELKASLNQK